MTHGQLSIQSLHEHILGANHYTLPVQCSALCVPVNAVAAGSGLTPQRVHLTLLNQIRNIYFLVENHTLTELTHLNSPIAGPNPSIKRLYY